jgi:hypothetical protein
MIDETLAIGFMAATCTALVASCRCSRRILANVLCKSVLKLALYRKEGSRIDFIWPHNVVGGINELTDRVWKSPRSHEWKLACVGWPHCANTA